MTPVYLTGVIHCLCNIDRLCTECYYPLQVNYNASSQNMHKTPFVLQARTHWGNHVQAAVGHLPGGNTVLDYMSATSLSCMPLTHCDHGKLLFNTAKSAARESRLMPAQFLELLDAVCGAAPHLFGPDDVAAVLASLVAFRDSDDYYVSATRMAGQKA